MIVPFNLVAHTKQGIKEKCFGEKGEETMSKHACPACCVANNTSPTAFIYLALAPQIPLVSLVLSLFAFPAKK